MMIRCKYFTGDFRGECAAGIAYESVKDQNTARELPRYPCRPDHEAFTTCAKFQVNRELARVSALCGSLVKINVGGYARKQECAELKAISTDGHYAYVVTVKGRQKSVPIGNVHAMRKGSKRR